MVFKLETSQTKEIRSPSTLARDIFDAFRSETKLERLIELRKNAETGKGKAKQEYVKPEWQLWVKVTEDEEIIGAGVWSCFDRTLQAIPEEFKDAEDDEEEGQDLPMSLLELQRPVLWADDGVLLCELRIIVKQAHPRRRVLVDTMLKQWGLMYADEMYAKCDVEAKLEEVNVYDQLGFMLQDQHYLIVPDTWASTTEKNLLRMTRPSKSREEEG